MTESNKGPCCPVCGKAAAPRAEKAVFPFCSTRCRTIDLGSWLDERYRFPDNDSERPVVDPDAGEILH